MEVINGNAVKATIWIFILICLGIVTYKHIEIVDIKKPSCVVGKTITSSKSGQQLYYYVDFQNSDGEIISKEVCAKSYYYYKQGKCYRFNNTEFRFK